MRALERTGTSRCAFCSMEAEEHEGLFTAWARGDLTGAEVGSRVGHGEDSWRKHLKRHVPGWQARAAEAAVVTGGEAERVRCRVLALAEAAAEPTDREHLLEISALMLRGSMLALAERGFTADATTGRTVQMLAAETERVTAALEEARATRRAEEAAAREVARGDGWAALEAFQEDLNGIMDEDPGLAARVIDAMHARQARSREAGRSPEKDWRMMVPKPGPLDEEDLPVAEVPGPDEEEDEPVEWGGSLEASPPSDG